MSSTSAPILPTRLVAFVKRNCPTCELVAPVLAQLAASGELTVYTQDDPTFPPGIDAEDDSRLDCSYRNRIEVVPTLIRALEGREEARVEGWHRGDWQKLAQRDDLGATLPDQRPGCGSLTLDPAHADELLVRFRGGELASRRVEIASLEDEIEALFDRNWSDGLPLVPPTEARVLRMLEGTTRVPDEIVATVAPDLAPCSVEKIAINAVMAGCKPEYLPVVIAAVEAICTDTFNIHGVLATTMPVGPVFVVNGPIRKTLGLNSGKNVFGQGNRGNLTIGRAVQLVIRNVGGGRPGEVDRAAFGNPGKLAFCFAEDEEGSPWTPLSSDFGVAAGVDTVTAFCGEAPRSVVDQLSRDPDSLARSFAVTLRNVHHPKLLMAFDCMLAIGPEHSRVFREAKWSKQQLIERLGELLLVPGAEVVRGVDGIAEGLPESVRNASLPKFRPGGLKIVHCGGGAGLFSSIIGGWVSGPMGSEPVLREITS